jgi:hypothetical protein
MANEAHKVDTFGYPVDPELRRLEFLLGDLAAQWRGSYDRPEAQQTIVREYHQTMDMLYNLGWDAELDLESHLPDGLMPEEYVKRNAGFFTPPHRYGTRKGGKGLSRPAYLDLEEQ